MTTTAEELDLTHTEGEDDVRVLGPSKKGSAASLHVERNRIHGTRSAESVWDDAVQVDEDEAPAPIKKKTNPSNAGKPMHSFFAKPKPASFNVDLLGRTDDVEMDAGMDQAVSSSAPIAGVDSTSLAGTTAKPVHGIFAAKSKRTEKNPTAPIETVNPFFTPAPTATIGRPGWAQHATIVKDALWPSAEEIELPSEYAIERPRLDLPRRARQRVGVGEDGGFWARLLPKAVVELNAKDAEQIDEPVIVDEYAGHPAITSLGDKATSGGKTQLWIDKYRPLDHTQVLGNEVPAKYLVDWLGELAIGIRGEVSEDRRYVQRKVIKTRRRQPREDDWIVQDDDPIRDFDDDGEAVDDAGAAQQTGYPDLNTRLTNSILLQGPYGSGKTASIHAAAAELGWEVFEVYPGIGKRSGASLSQLVGDVGKNHMVGKGRSAMPPSPAPQKTRQNPLPQAFAKAPGKPKCVDVAASAPVDLTDSPGKKTAVDRDFGFVAPAETRDSKSGGPDVRQSLILLEEVDILFEEDKGFWPAVVTLIEESKRPVIMTCNGKFGDFGTGSAADLFE